MTFDSLVWQKAQVALSLGPMNLLRIIQHRLGIRLGLNPVLRLKADVPHGLFFKMSEQAPSRAQAVETWEKVGYCFGQIRIPVSTEPPDWLSNPLTGKHFDHADRPWWQIPDFDPAVGDIKLIWELSRFDWVLAFAERIRNGDGKELSRLNRWLADWCESNPPYFGPNWKCGQEASIRVMHLAMAAMILNQTAKPLQALVDLIRFHLRRIAPTIGYSIAQDNNHGTSEAAALFIGGSWLESLGFSEAGTWASSGRKWLENRVRRLIEPDGSFSQYSVNYHRVMLDTLSMVEVWRRYLELQEFSDLYRSRAADAARWLAAFVDTASGDAPNIGANDGARLLQLSRTDYRDFRPSVQLAMDLFTGERVYSEQGTWNDPLDWLGVSLPLKQASNNASKIFDYGGYAVLKRSGSMAVLRYPRFRFRPSHADALHLDFWRNGENLLRDSGTFSYNTDSEWLDYFPGTASHNTVQFDDRDQMPRVSRFLFGEWLKTDKLESFEERADETRFGAAYCDRFGARHKRTVRLMNDRLIVYDEVSGFTEKAVFRWRLKPAPWHLSGQTLSDERHQLKFFSNSELSRVEIATGWESRYYGQKSPLPVLELEMRKAGTMTIEYRW
jgi:hypothetical protein